MWRMGKRGGGCGWKSSKAVVAVARRTGKGGGVCNEDEELGESLKTELWWVGRGGGGGGTTTLGRFGVFEGFSMLVSLSLDTRMRLDILEIALSED